MTIDLAGSQIGPDIDRRCAVIATAASRGEEDPRDVLKLRGLRYKDTASLMAMAVSTQLLSDSALPDLKRAPERTAIVVGSNLCNVDTVSRVSRELAEGGVGATSPMDLPNASPNVVASSVAILHRFSGPNLLVSGVACVERAMQIARRLVAARRADHVLVIGVEPPTREAVQIGGERSGALAVLIARESDLQRPAGFVDRHGFTPCIGVVDEKFAEVWTRLTSPAPRSFTGNRQ